MTTFLTSFGMYCPCDKATYRKLKRIRHLTGIADLRTGTWTRWNNKLPKNRIIKKGPNKGQSRPEPELFSRFFTLIPWVKYSWQNNFGEGQSTHHVRTTDDYSRFMEDYVNARYPKATAEEVKPLLMSDQEIDDLLKEIQEWWSK